MDQGLVFWDKYFKCQTEVTWDELASKFKEFILQYGQIHLDDNQLLYIKSLIDPDYRNLVKVAHFLIFQDTFWKIISKRQLIFKYQFQQPVFNIPPQKMKGLKMKIIAITHGYPRGERDIILTRETWTLITEPQNQQLTETNPYIQSMHIVQTPAKEHTLKQEEVFLIGSSEHADFVVQQDLQMNPFHLKLVWTPYNLFLIKDISKSFRSKLRLSQTYLLDYQMVISLSNSTAFIVKFINPLPQFKDSLITANIHYIETAQEDSENYFPYLVKQLELNRFGSVLEYRQQLEGKKIQNPDSQLSRTQMFRRGKLPTYKEMPDTPQLTIEFVEGPLKGEQYILDDSKEEYIIGKSKICNIVVPDNQIQSQHTQIRYVKEHGWLMRGISEQRMQVGSLLKQSQKNKTQKQCQFDQTIFGTFIYLANSTQRDLGIASKAHVVQNEMTVQVGPYLFQMEYLQ